MCSVLQAQLLAPNFQSSSGFVSRSSSVAHPAELISVPVGGGFEFGSTQTYDASFFINKSVALGEEVLYVATNYRLGGFGFLGGQQLKNEGNTNLGLHDQRLAMQYVLLTPSETRGEARNRQGAVLTTNVDGYRTILPLSVVILRE